MAGLAKKAGIGLICLAALGLGGWATLPHIVGLAIAATCPLPLSENCQNRMRALGHIWSRRGNPERAAQWYERGAQAGDPSAMFHLAWVQGDMLVGAQQGENHCSARDPTPERVKWYRQAADLGFAPAMNNLGQIMVYGPNTAGTLEEGHRWHLAAAEAGNPAAAVNVVSDFLLGSGTARDMIQVERWSHVKPANAAAVDLLEPTLARTLVVCDSWSADERHDMRLAATEGTEVTIVLRSMTPDPSLPTFGGLAGEPK